MQMCTTSIQALRKNGFAFTGVELLKTLIETTYTPVLLRTDCSFQKSKLSQVEHTHLPIVGFPSTYRFSSYPNRFSQESDPNEPVLDFTPHLIGSDEDPLESGDGTMALVHIVCLVPPNVKLNGRDRQMDRTVDSLTFLRSTLHRDAYDAVSKIQSDLEHLMYEEVLDGLLQLPHVEESKLVHKAIMILQNKYRGRAKLISSADQLADETRQLDSKSSILISIPMAFVRTQSRAITLMRRELEASGSRSKGYQVRGFGSYFRLCAVRENDLSSTVKPHWILLAIKANSVVDLFYFSKQSGGDERKEAVRIAYQMIVDCIERVNRSILLTNLNSTHRSSPYLIPSAVDDDAGDKNESTSSDDDETSGTSSYETPTRVIRQFKPGQFACPVVFERTFPIHWRLKPQQALNTVLSSFGPLMISNRHNMFVFAVRDSIFYIRLGYVSSEILHQPFSPDAGSDDLVADSAKINSPSAQRPPISEKVTAGSAKLTEQALVLQFHGIDLPPAEVTMELVSLVDSKLSSLTHSVLNALLARTNTVRLTKADVDFIIPVRKTPSRRVFFLLPDTVEAPGLYLGLLRHILVGKGLSVLSGTDVVNVLRQHYGTTMGLSEGDSDSGKGSVRIGDLSFLYNCIKSRNASQLEMSVGSGTISLSFALILPDGKVAPVVRRVDVGENASRFFESITPLEVLSEPPLPISQDQGSLSLLAEVWSHGGVDLDAFIAFLKEVTWTCLMDYVIECNVQRIGSIVDPGLSRSLLSIEESLNRPNEAPGESTEEMVTGIVGRTFEFLMNSSTSANLCVQKLTSLVNLPSWIISDFGSMISDMLLDITGSPPVTLKVFQNSSPSFVDGGSYIVVGIPSLVDMLEGDTEYGGQYESMVLSLVEGSMELGQSESGVLLHGEDDYPEKASRVTGKRRSYLSGNGKNQGSITLLSDPIYLHTQEQMTRSQFLIMRIKHNEVFVVTYNWSSRYIHSAFRSILHCLSFHNIKMQHMDRLVPRRGASPESRGFGEALTGISYSSSYSGVSSMATAMARRNLGDQTPSADEFRRLYFAETEILQNEAVEFLDWFVIFRKELLSSADSEVSRTGRVNASSVRAKSADHFTIGHTRDTLQDELDIGASPSQLAAIFRSVGLHYLKYPNFLVRDRSHFLESGSHHSALDRALMVTAMLQGPHPHKMLAASWETDLEKAYFDEYIAYMQTLGLEVISRSIFEKAKEHRAQNHGLGIMSASDTPGVARGADAQRQKPLPIYLKRDIGSGVLLLQLGVENECFCVNLYSVRLDAKEPHLESGHRFGTENEADSEFKRESNALKTSLHLNSFSHDFYARYFYSILNASNGQPLPFHLIEALEAFTKYNNRRSIYARSRLLGLSCKADHSQQSSSLFQYILKTPGRYGFQPVIFNGEAVACFLSSTSPDFLEHSKFPEGALRFTIVLYFYRPEEPQEFSANTVRGTPISPSFGMLDASGKSSGAFPVSGGRSSAAARLSEHDARPKYYLLIVDEEQKFPLDKLDAKAVSFGEKSPQEILSEYLANGCYLADIVNFAEKRIETLLERSCFTGEIIYGDKLFSWKNLRFWRSHPFTIQPLKRFAGNRYLWNYHPTGHVFFSIGSCQTRVLC
ncbi:hypothetical protein DFJ73DRAFT_244081 [Zopfochytrium polystomum]|nr:hypothetical protein DFJ73DRAFT_244081 [Zopfochytrium polystomum]